MRTLFIGLSLTAALFAQTATAPAKSTTAKSKSAATKSKAAGTTPAKAAAKPAATADHPIAVFDTSMGKIACELFPDKAPKTVANFIGLARGTKDWKHPYTGQEMKGTPLYDNTTFHRVIPNFMIQGGDPVGNGTGDPGYRFEDELVPDLKFDQPGRLAMANSGPNTDGSQFFITESENPHLDACLDEQGCMRGQRLVPKGYGYTIFGQCDQPSVAVVTKIARVATDPRNNKPLEPVTVKHIQIIGAEEPAKPVAAPAKAPGKAKSKAKSKSKTKAKSQSNPAAQQPK